MFSELQIQCYEWGMQPSEYRECTLLDIAYYIVGNMNRVKAESEVNNMRIYELSKLIGIMNAVNLSNALSGKKHSNKEYPTYEKVFGKDKNNNNYSHNGDVYEVINDKNKHEFLLKQKKAYEKMGYKV